jgi:hypothetical protein
MGPAHALLGFAVWQVRRLPVVGWRGRPIIEVFETEDASLICTAYSRWGRQWEVCSAEDHLIGVCRSTAKRADVASIEDPYGRTIIRVVGTNGCGYRRLIRESVGIPVGAITLTAEGTRLEFDTGSGIDQNPFVRMLMLTAGLLT